MLGKTLKELSIVGDAARFDLRPRDLTLLPTETSIVAYYRGAYVSAGKEVDALPGELTRAVSLDPSNFRGLVRLFEDDAEVRLTCAAASINLASATSTATARYKGAPEPASMWEELRTTEVAGRLPLDVFKTEIGIASAAVAPSVLVPILTGVRLVARGAAMGFAAANGSSLMFQSRLRLGRAPDSGDEQGLYRSIEQATPFEHALDLILPVTEVEAALALFEGEEEVSLGYSNRSFVLVGRKAAMRIPVISGTWARLPIPDDLSTFEACVVPAAALRAIAAAVRVLEANPYVTLRPSEQGVVLETDETEGGRYQYALSGALTRAFSLDSRDLETATKTAGDPLALLLSTDRAVIRSGGRTLVLNTRVVE